MKCLVRQVYGVISVQLNVLSFQVVQNELYSRWNKTSSRYEDSILTNKSPGVKTVARLLVGGMKCLDIKCPGLTVAGRGVAVHDLAIAYPYIS